MTDIDIAAPLAAALAARGYAALTPVQEAVLADGVAGRDLLVSAQTGSGKTVAFGIAIAPDILAGADRLLFADVPLALVVAPTRELALQVARELDWLYADAGAQIATCVGGMDYRTERRALDRGAHIVVGTPGRLRDHIERGSLDLSGLRAAVLDEADEMLDLGFREDLEFILNAAPATRRTLMFSATVPKAIAELAKEFQTDALRLQTAGEARQHVDIEYRAMSVAARDRDHAIFNALRYYDARSAIVFCKTRANVNNLLARMGNRGFQVVALSGELSQQERTHALQALRDGRAKVCIATDVAARGIDLPGLDLVIHADLPSNPETLLHRSGRTGRAGAKGVSALIVVPAEFKKAQRLLQGAKVVAEWGAAPGADEVQAKDDLRLMDHPTLAAGPGEEAAMADALLGKFGAQSVAAAFVRLWREGRSAPEVLQDQAMPAASARHERGERGEFGESVWFELSVGRSGRAEARWLLPKICEAGGIAKDGIGAIRVQEDRTFVQIAKAVAGRFGAAQDLEAGLVMTRLDGEPTLDRPERSPRKTFERPERRAPAPRPLRDDADRPAKPEYRPKPPRIVEDDSPASPPRDPAPAPAPARAAVTDRKPYAKRDEPRPFTPRAPGEKPYAPKPYAKRDDGDRKPSAPRPYVKREDGANPSRPKPYAKRDDGDRKPSAPTGAKPYAKRDDSDRKPYAPREDGDRKPRAKGEAGRSAGFKSHGSPDRPGKSAGFKSHGAEGKPYRPKAEGAEGKPFRAKPAGEGKPSKARPAKPAAPKADPRDTSKRFVPPKKPK
jgi:ATP-dependent RNA helicase DeaD